LRLDRIAAHVFLLAILVALPHVLSSYGTHIANVALIYVILAVGLSVALGYAGQVNLAQAACFGMGAYTVAVVTLHTSLGWWAALPLSIVGAALLGLVVALPSLRVQSHYLGIVTLGLATPQRIEWASVAHQSQLARERQQQA
jgi:branched-chain amino acid transport system permease protein